ncbi:MAG: GNAT family N-acetyltransferase [Nitrososphaerota archaeon]|nr:GNAT family N-acetyltransferase [Nitrososphaerota archaeon]
MKTDPAAFGSSFEEEAGFTEEKWKERMDDVFFAFAEGTPIGMLSIVFNDRVKRRHAAHIFGVYVTPRHRRAGAGRALLKAALSEAREHGGIVKVQLGVVPQMRAAVALYRSAGFRTVGRAKKEIKVGRRYYDMLTMEKLL